MTASPRRRASVARILLPIVLAVAAAGLAACGGRADDGLVVYSGRNRELIDPLLARFERETGIDVTVSYKGDSTNLALLIDQEGDKSPADVFISQSPGAMGFLDAEDRLERLPARILDRVPEAYRAADGDWVGLSGRVRVLVYDRAEHDPADLPDSVFQLTEPRYRGKVGIAPTNASFQDFVSAMRTLRGDAATRQWLEAMAANGVETYPDNLSIVAAVDRGEIEYGLVNHYYNERITAENPDATTANHFMPGTDEPGAIVLAATAGIIDTVGDERADAERLVEFLVSDSAQQYFAEQTFEYPLVAGIATASDLPPLASLAAPRIDLAELGADLAGTREMIRDAGLERG